MKIQKRRFVDLGRVREQLNGDGRRPGQRDLGREQPDRDTRETKNEAEAT